MEWKRHVGRTVLVVVALGYTGFFALNLMKPHAFRSRGHADRNEQAPVFVATTPATARLPELGEELDVAPEKTADGANDGVQGGANEKSQLALDKTTPNANKFRNKRSKSINDDLGMDLLQAADETLADANNPSREMSESMLKSLGISKKQYALIKMREKRLAQKLRAAEERGSDGFKKILKTDHSDWMKEFLGPDRYQRFIEVAGNL